MSSTILCFMTEVFRIGTFWFYLSNSLGYCLVNRIIDITLEMKSK